MKIKDYINHLSAEGKRWFTTSEIKAALGVSDKAVWNAIERLKEAGELASPAKGFYLIIPPEYRTLKCLPPEFFIHQLMAHWKMQYYVCLQSAAMYYGATHQQTQIFYVMVPKNRPMIHCGKVRIEFIAKKQISKIPIQTIKTAAGYINVSTPEATAMDIICYAKKCGLNSVFTLLEELAEVMRREPLRALADASNEKYWLQRLGFLLEELGHLELSKILYESLKHHSTHIIPLATYLPMKGFERNLKWKIAINTHLESDLCRAICDPKGYWTFSQKNAIFVKKEAFKVHIGIQVLVKNRIVEHGRGWCFTPMNFLDLGNETSVRKALSHLQKQNIIRRLAQGVYDYPKTHDLLGTIPPDLNEVAQAIADKNGVQIQPAGAHAANLVGFSTQVPGRIIFLTEGPSRKVKIGNQEIIFKKTTKKMMSSAGTREGLLIQALKNLGRDHIDLTARAQAAKFLEDSSEKEIRKQMTFAPAWIRALVFEIMELKP